MIMQSEEVPLDTNLETSNFNIEMNGTMFSMLSKNVYNDIILAPIREWSTNAVDACIAAGTDIKFDVHLPTVEESTFSVRDYGTGLTDEEVTTLFATFGASTKRNSNKFNGTFGIGRMSGLAYTNQFTIETFVDKSHTTYLVTTKDSIPQMIKLGSTFTEEPNGLKLSLAVDPLDTKKFKSKAEFLYKFFSHKPTVNLKLNMEIEKNVEGKDWYLNADQAQYYKSDSYAVMGNVPYRINRYETNFPHGYVINVPLGKLSITPGRESLNYDSATKNTLKEYKETIEKETAQVIVKSINNIPKNSYKDISLYNKSIIGKHFSNTVKDSVRSSSTILNLHDKFYLNNYSLCFELSHTINSNIELKTKAPYESRFKAGYRVSIDDSNIFMIMDTRTKASLAAEAYLKEVKESQEDTGNYRTVVALTMPNFSKANLDNFKEEAKQLLADIGITKYKFSSDYVSDKKGSTAVKAFKPIGISLNHSFNTLSTYKLSKLGSEYKKAVYVPVSGSVVEDKDQKVVAYIKALKLYEALTNKPATTTVLGVNKTYLKDAENMSNFITLFDYVEELFDGTTMPVNVPVNQEVSTNLYRNLDYVMGKQSWLTMTWPEDINEYYTKVKEFYKQYPHTYKAATCKVLNSFFKLNIVKPSTEHTAINLNAKYPLVNRLLDYNCTLAEMNHYIELLEK